MRRLQRVLNRNEQISRHFLKLVSVIFAFFLWFYVLNSEPQVVEQVVSLNLKSPPGLSVANIVPTKVKVTLKGSRAFIRNVLKREDSVHVDLKNYPIKKKGGFKVFLGPNDVTVPFGVEVLALAPDSFDVTLQKEIRKEVPIRPELVGEIATDLKLISKKISPKKVLISGPIEVLRKISKVHTAPIDVSHLQGSGELKISLGDLDQRVSVKRFTAVDFKYVVKPRKANLTLKKIKINFLSSSTRIKSKIKYVSLDVLAPENVKITRSDIQVIAEVPDKKGAHRVKLRAKLPEGIHLLQINPQSINVSIR